MVTTQAPIVHLFVFDLRFNDAGLNTIAEGPGAGAPGYFRIAASRLKPRILCVLRVLCGSFSYLLIRAASPFIADSASARVAQFTSPGKVCARAE